MEPFGDGFQICPHCGYVVGTHAEEAIHMDPGTLLHDRYIVGRVLGYGGFGTTYIGWDGKLEQKVAIKEYLPGEFSTRMPGQTMVTVFNGDKSEQFKDGMKKFVEEAKHLAKFQNEPGIVKIFDSFEENGTAYIVMEYLDGMTMTDYLKQVGTIPEDDAVAMLMPIMTSLETVHAEGLLHRDIAPDNIFITREGDIKLIDFGASRYATTSHSRSLTVIIKPGYSPEEQYRSRGDQGPYTDVYALAATLYRMITGKTPPDAMERRAKYENQNKDILVPPHKLMKGLSVRRENAILNAMNVRIEDRTPDVETFIQELTAEKPAKRIYGKIKKLDLYAWPLWLKIGVPTALAAVIAFGVLLLTGVISFNRYSTELEIPDHIVAAPDVEGLIMDEAIQKIKDSGLQASTGGTIDSEYIGAGKVILQTPVGGSFTERNSTVKLTLSAGNGAQAPVNGISTIPYVIADPVEDAKVKLRSAGLDTPDIEEAYDDNIEEGHVISTSIDAGKTIAEGSKIKLVVSMGPAFFGMYDMSGKTLKDAVNELEAKGLIVSLEYAADNKVPEGCVIRQNVEVGTQVKKGDAVLLTICSGKKITVVANVVGKTQAEAEETLKAQNLVPAVVENYDPDIPAGQVIKQSPAADTSQPEESTVTIIVSKGPQYITVKFDGNGGSGSNDLTVIYGKTYGKLPTPSRKGYTFTGWTTAKDGGSAVNAETKIFTTDTHTLFAQWKINNYTVSFNANGGTASGSSVNKEFGSAIGTLPTATRTGYNFAGWFTAASGGSQAGAATKVEDNMTLYAHWTPIMFTVTFNGNGGSASKGSAQVAYGTAIGTLPGASRTGYGLVGWFTAANGGNQISANTTVTGNMTVYAHWSNISYTVTFNGNGGSNAASMTVTHGAAIGNLPTSSRTGYTFDGWFTAASGGTQVSAQTAVTGNMTLYAHWNVNKYQLTFNGNGGNASTASVSVNYGAAIGTLPTATRTGYNFAGWWTAASGGNQVSAQTTVTGNMTLYAHWNVKQFTLTFNGNGGTSPSAKTINYGAAYGTLTNSTRDYYKFLGWFTAASGGSQVSANTTMGEGNVTVYAHWEQNPVSDWVLASNMPSGAQIVEQKWTYTRTTTQTKDSTSSPGSGWVKGSRVDWSKTGSGSREYATFPSGYDTSNTYYTTMRSGAYSASETSDKKVTVSNSQTGWIYWHWMYDVTYANTTTRAISHRKGSYDQYGNSGGFNYKYFTAIKSTKDCPYLDKYYCCSQNLPSYNCHSIISDTTHVGTPRMFRFEYYTSVYTEYAAVFRWTKTTTTQETSTSQVTAGGEISNVQKWVRYRPK